MAGSVIVTDMEVNKAMKLVRFVAKEEGYAVRRIEEDELTIRKGDLASSIFLGAFVAYCFFNARFDFDRQGGVEIELERNNPWWTGFIGVGRVKSAFKKLIDAIEDEIEHAGHRILRSEDF